MRQHPGSGPTSLHLEGLSVVMKLPQPMQSLCSPESDEFPKNRYWISQAQRKSHWPQWRVVICCLTSSRQKSALPEPGQSPQLTVPSAAAPESSGLPGTPSLGSSKGNTVPSPPLYHPEIRFRRYPFLTQNVVFLWLKRTALSTFLTI